jgi:hypothetical protein
MSMKIFDRLMGLEPEACQQDDPHYKIYDIGKKLAAVGIAACAAGVIGIDLGLETAGTVVGLSGATLDLLGGATMVLELPYLQNDDNTDTLTV